ncbi:relaxase/mobilization nuclease domain-containing protein [Leifsonia shinshuensis]
MTRGDRMAGLMTYLVGEGRANEHTEPHLVGGDPGLMAWHDDAELGRESGIAIARHLDRASRNLDVDVPGGHVWHCSLSLHAEEGMLTDEQWGEIANDFVKAMEFDDNEGSKAPCSWVAVRHGVSKAGNDHIHIAVNLVREDGTKASVHNDFRRAQTAARALEVKYGLQQLESVRAERATRGFKPAEQARIEEEAARSAERKFDRAQARLPEAERQRWLDLAGRQRQQRIAAEYRLTVPRAELARTVRASAAAAADEGEFVRRMRRAGVLVRPRYADGRTDVITGYSVAAKPAPGERPIWYGGGHLGRDLTLPRLREGWDDDPRQASTAAAEWNAAKRGRRVVAPGREEAEPTPQQWDEANARMTELRDRLRTVPTSDRAGWATAARQTAGAFAAWSKAVEPTPGPLAAAADALSVSAQTYARPVRPQRAGLVSAAGAALMIAAAGKSEGTVAQAVMLRQLMSLAGAIHGAVEAAADARAARRLVEDVRGQLAEVAERLPRPPREELARYGLGGGSSTQQAPELDAETRDMLARIHGGQQSATEALRSPVPNKIDPSSTPTPAKPGRDRDVER